MDEFITQVKNFQEKIERIIENENIDSAVIACATEHFFISSSLQLNKSKEEILQRIADCITSYIDQDSDSNYTKRINTFIE